MSPPISLAPMAGKTERDWRRIMRFITRGSLLYTPMISAAAVLRGKRDRLLAFDPAERPLVLQLGWNEASALAECCRIAEDYGYNGINLNCGCPSSRVQRHKFGACMMANPKHVASLVDAMVSATDLAVSVKCRIGIRSRNELPGESFRYSGEGIRSKGSALSLESYEHLKRFVDVVSRAGCHRFTVHARIAILEGLSPKENRIIPPLRYEDVYRLKADFPHLFIEINGGFRNLADIDAALLRVDGVMLGRIALDNPYMLSRIDALGGDERPLSRRDIFEMAVPYIVRRAEQGVPRGLLIAPLLNLYKGRPGAGATRRLLNQAVSCPPDNFARFLEAIPHRAATPALTG